MDSLNAVTHENPAAVSPVVHAKVDERLLLRLVHDEHQSCDWIEDLSLSRHISERLRFHAIAVLGRRRQKRNP